MVWSPRTFFLRSLRMGAVRTMDDTLKSFYLWIDTVGGYLVCPSAVVTLGSVESGRAEVLLSGELAALHARLVRDEDGYLLEALGPVRVDGKRVTQTVLADRCLLELGEGVRLRFVRPHPWSLSARLEFASGHRTVPSTDGILLLARNLVLGPGAQSHVVCPSWDRELLIFRDHTGLCCRGEGLLKVDGRVVRGEARLGIPCRAEGANWRFHVEPAK